MFALQQISQHAAVREASLWTLQEYEHLLSETNRGAQKREKKGQRRNRTRKEKRKSIKGLRSHNQSGRVMTLHGRRTVTSVVYKGWKQKPTTTSVAFTITGQNVRATLYIAETVGCCNQKDWSLLLPSRKLDLTNGSNPTTKKMLKQKSKTQRPENGIFSFLNATKAINWHETKYRVQDYATSLSRPI